MHKTQCAIPVLLFFFSQSCIGFSGPYFYELYQHFEYYAEPPGFPNKLTGMPIIAISSSGTSDWEKRFAAGIIEALRLTHDHLWIEFITGFGTEKARYTFPNNHTTEISRTGFDDFLIDFGYNFLIDSEGKAQIMLHWLTGIPLCWEITESEALEPLIGTRRVATGPVIECAYDFIRTEKEDLFLGFVGRFLHRFSRDSFAPTIFKFKPGFATDLLFVFHYRNRGHNIEVGYNPTFINGTSTEVLGQTQHLPSETFATLYVDYSYYIDQLSLLFGTGLVGSFNHNFRGLSWYSTVSWYF